MEFPVPLVHASAGESLAVSGVRAAPLRRSVSTHGQLLYSNNPERFGVVADTGLTLLCQNIVQPGAARLFLFHVNQAGRPAKVSVVLEPVGTPATVTITRRGLDTPSEDYTGIGIRVQERWFRSRIALPRRVAGPIVLDPALERWSGGDGALFHALYSWESDQPLLVSVVALPAEASSLALYSGAPHLIEREPPSAQCDEDFYARGLYMATKSVICAYDTEMGARWLPVGHRFCSGVNPTGDSAVSDGWVPGFDITPAPPEDGAEFGPYLPGNFGVLYQLTLHLTGVSPVAVILQGLGASVQGAFDAAPGLTEGGVTAFGPVTGADRGVLIGRYAPPTAPEIQVMPAGNVSLPWRILLIPYEP